MEDKKQPLVSVIIACYNGEKYIDSCLESLVNQTYTNIEVIICDDASKDGSLALLNKWAAKDSRIVVLHNKKNLFAAATRNTCLEMANGKFIAIQDVDDVSDVNRIEKLVAVMNAEDIDFVSSAAGAFYDNPTKIDIIYSGQKEYPTKWSFLWGIPFFHPATLFTKECLKRVDGYRIAKETRRGQDYDLFMRLYAAGYKGKIIPDVLYYYRLDMGNIKRRNFDSTIGEFIIRWKGFKKLRLFPWALPFVFKPFVSHVIQLFRYYGKR